MKISLIAAVSVGNFGIGKKGGLCYHISEDLRRFRDLTMGKPILMGRGTWESLPHALSGRRNIIITTTGIDAREEDAGLIEVYSSIEEALEKLRSEGCPEVMVIGGGSIYKQTLPMADTLYLTEIFATPGDADTFFPPYHGDFTCVEREYRVNDGLRYEFTTYERDDRVQVSTM